MSLGLTNGIFTYFSDEVEWCTNNVPVTPSICGLPTPQTSSRGSKMPGRKPSRPVGQADKTPVIQSVNPHNTSILYQLLTPQATPVVHPAPLVDDSTENVAGPCTSKTFPSRRKVCWNNEY